MKSTMSTSFAVHSLINVPYTSEVDAKIGRNSMIFIVSPYPEILN